MPTSDLFQTLEHAEAQGDALEAGLASFDLGERFVEEGNYAEALVYYQKSVEYLSPESAPREYARARTHLGIVQALTGNPTDAIANLQEALEIAIQMKNRSLEAIINGNLGFAYAVGQDYERAAEFHHEALDAAIELGDSQMELQAQLNIADVYFQDKRYTQSMGFALVALDLARELKNPRAEIMALDLLGRIYVYKKNLRKSIQYHKKAAKLAEEIGALEQMGIALANKGLSHARLTEQEKAEASLEEAIAIFRSIGSPYLQKAEEDLRKIRETGGSDEPED